MNISVRKNMYIDNETGVIHIPDGIKADKFKLELCGWRCKRNGSNTRRS